MIGIRPEIGLFTMNGNDVSIRTNLMFMQTIQPLELQGERKVIHSKQVPNSGIRKINVFKLFLIDTTFYRAHRSLLRKYPLSNMVTHIL